ncbi:hypothetical protein O7606_13465 [Micromonospora sp. WMMD882]|uniref:hypothetical protein n=1 Tax=Micromonospora sp. WMMD882 TaxID=3015151 RepID=UPI00248AF351|nr:hypothetical protein [Micromonospora sp. WMMD882]WBB77309.1 hypothetical protein O7606_13465 [Micromonospora sp. WMMD882]
MLVHGLLGTPEAHFGACAPWWGHPVTPFNLPGHGPRQETPGDQTAVAVDELCELVHAQPERPLLVGISYLGAAVAFRAAEKAVGSVHGLVMSGFSFTMRPDGLDRWLTAFTRMAREQQPSREYFARLHGDRWPRLISATAEELRRGLLRIPDRTDLERLDLPALLVNGALLEAERLAVQPAAQSGADVAVVAGAGHLVPRDCPRSFVAAVEEFSARIDQRRTVFHERRRSGVPESSTAATAPAGAPTVPDPAPDAVPTDAHPSSTNPATEPTPAAPPVVAGRTAATSPRKEPAPPRVTAGHGLAGYGIARVCSLSLDEIAGLSSRRLADLVDEADALDARWHAESRRVAETLTPVVPRLTDRGQRRRILDIRRLLHRGGELTDDHFADLAEIPEVGEADRLPRLRALRRRRTEVTGGLAEAYEQARRAEQAVLAELGLRPEILMSAQLTGANVAQNLRRFARDVAAGQAGDKRSRTTEATLVNLVARSALKPSPFSRLVHTRPVLFTDDAETDVAGQPATTEPGSPRSVCRLPRQLVEWVERTLCRHSDLRPALVLRRAPIVARAKGGVALLVRGRDGTDQPASAERVVRAEEDDLLAVLLDLPADQPVSLPELRRRCAERFDVDPAALRAGVEELVTSGVLGWDLGVDEQEPTPMLRLARLLPPDGDPRLRGVVARLSDIEAGFGPMGPEQREAALADVRRCVTELAELCDAPLPPLEAARSLIYEDLVTTRPRTESRADWQRHLPALSTLHDLAPLFDDDAHVRAIVADVVGQTFGPGPHRLLPLYSALSTPRARALLTRRLRELSAPVPTELRRLQDAVLAQAAPHDGVETTLDRRRLTEVVAELPAWVARWERVGWQVQRTRAADPLLVVNDVSLGYARPISRFCAAYEMADEGSADFTARVRADIARHDDPDAPLTDLCAVLGINSNVHPPLLGRHLRYPCGTPGEWGADSGISLEDCWAEVDTTACRLRLRHGRTGPVLRLVPLNFLLNDLAPQFYRFLNFFGAGTLANIGWWDRVDQRRPDRPGIRRYPRVRLDDVVLARRAWKVSSSELPVVDGLSRLDAHRAVRRWRADVGLPEQVFCRSLTVPDPLVPRTIDEQESWSRRLQQFPSSAERKPALVDFTSVTSVSSWFRTLRRGAADLTFQECLPEVGPDRPGDPGGHVTEFTIETTAEAG